MEIIRQTAVASFVVVPLIDAANRPSYKASPTLAAGDVVVIRHTGGVWNVSNIGTLPAVVDAGATKQILVTLTATELTSDNLDYPIIVQFVDQTATKEWDDQEIIVWTKALPANATQLAGQTITAAAGVTFPTSVASPTNITAGTIANLTNERSKYMHGAVWISAAGAAGTVSYTNGIMTNPVTGMADAKTIADNLLLKKFYTQSGTTITLIATMANYVFDGWGWNLDLGGRAISNSVFQNCRSVTGVSSSSGPTAYPVFENCEFGATATIPASNLNHCEFSGTVTLVGGGNYDFIDCSSIVAGTGTPVFDVNSVVNTNISFRRWSGGITINNIVASTVISIDVVSGGTVTLNGVGGNVQVRGMAANVVDNRTGSPTLGTNAVINQSAIGTQVWTTSTPRTVTSMSGLTSDANLVSIDGTALASATLNLKKLNIINNSGDAIYAESTGSSGRGIHARGHAGSSGIFAIGGATGDGINGSGGITSGNGFSAYAGGLGHGIIAAGAGASRHGIYAASTGTSAMGILAEGVVAGLKVTASAGDGALIVGGSNGAGCKISGDGTGAAIDATAGATGDGIKVVGGATSGNGIAISAPVSGHGIVSSGEGVYKDGMRLQGGNTGHGLGAIGGPSEGSGIFASGTVGASVAHGINAVGKGAGAGIFTTGGEVAGTAGIYASSGIEGGVGISADGSFQLNKTGVGLLISGGLSGGNAVTINSPVAIGMSVTGATDGAVFTGTSGDDMRGDLNGSVVSVTNRVTANSDQINGVAAAATQLAKSAAVIISGTVDNTGFTPTASAFECSDITSAGADYYKGRTVIFTSGSLIGQARRITAYTVTGGRGHFSVDALTAAPANGVTLVIV